MNKYLDLLDEILEEGTPKEDRTGTGTLSLFGKQLCFDLQSSFPVITTKKVHLRAVVHELLWFLKGQTNIAMLQNIGIKIWNAWADENGELGPIYGAQWRKWRTADGTYIDQIDNAIQLLKFNPESRRIIVSAWNVGELDKMALEPCHTFFQFYVADGNLSCQLYQRSADIFLGVPFNITSYALLTTMIAQITGLGLGEFIHTFGDVHLYTNHQEQARLQLSRKPLPPPQLQLNTTITDIDDFKFEDIEILNYKFHPAIKAPVAI